ncbi:MAG: alpha/beta hydrolase [Peptoniphilus harei]|nr:alpha/beta hydrolase [Peptoniphilus harei]
MDFIEVNKENKKTILLIHPLGFTAEAMKNLIADKLPSDYRYIIPELAGHGKSKEVFKSTEIEAKKIENYLLEKGIREIDLALGASLGGLVLLNLLNSKKIKFNKCIFEACSLSEGSKIKEILARKFVMDKQKKALKDRKFALDEIEKFYGKQWSNIIADTLIGMDKKSVTNLVKTFVYAKVPKLSKADQEKCIFCYGSEEFNLKDSKKILEKKLPKVKVKIWKGYNHCEIIAKDNLKYCKFLEGEI